MAERIITLQNSQTSTHLQAQNGTVCGWDQNLHDEQIWILKPSGDPEKFLLVNKANQKLIFAPGPNQPVAMHPQGPGVNPDMLWWIRGADTFVRVENCQYPGHVLDLANGNKANGTQVYCWSSHGGYNQKWRMWTYDYRDDGELQNHTNCFYGDCEVCERKRRAAEAEDVTMRRVLKELEGDDD